jgi:fumarate reductase flavoprotein subunit
MNMTNLMIDEINRECTEKWDKQADVIIVGAGDAGLAAAIESADIGGSTLILEKMSTLKPTSSAMSGGTFAFAGTDLQQRHGVQDSEDLFFKDIMHAGKWENNQSLVHAFMKKQLNTYEWLTALGVKWLQLMTTGGMSVPRGHNTNAFEHVKILQEAALKRGVGLLFRTKVTNLITNKDKRIIGVSAQSEAQSLRIKARKGVILATGGFGHDVARMKMIDSRFVNVTVIAGAGHTGDGHRMAELLGARFEHMGFDYLKPTIGIHPSSHSHKTNLKAFWFGAILVNSRGNRFVNESLENRTLGEASLSQPRQIVYQIFDQKTFKKGQRENHEITEVVMKLLVKAETIQELASKIGIPPQALKETVDRYNKNVDNGKDLDFGRTSLVGGVGIMIKIDTLPFYAYATVPWLPGTYAGVKVDEDMHVLTNEGKIPALYGAGEFVGGFHGAGHHTGTALAKAVVFGRIAGRNCAQGK